MNPSPPDSLIAFDVPIYTSESNHNQPENATLKDRQSIKDKQSTAQLQDILNSMLPPRSWKEDTGEWMQYTSSAPSTRLDVINLQETMDDKLVTRQARETGICPVREDIYSQCFVTKILDELIRQVTINLPERGLLALRVRDEIKMTIDAYKTLYDSSVTFGVRKQLQSEQGMGDLEKEVEKLRNQKTNLENKVLELNNKVEVIEKRATERRTLLEKRRKEEIDFLKNQGQHLESFLKSVGGSK